MSDLTIGDVKVTITVDIEYQGNEVNILQFVGENGYCDITLVDGGAKTVTNALNFALIEIEDKFGDKSH